MAKRKVSMDNIMTLSEQYSQKNSSNKNKVSMDNIMSLSQKYSSGELAKPSSKFINLPTADNITTTSNFDGQYRPDKIFKNMLSIANQPLSEKHKQSNNINKQILLPTDNTQQTNLPVSDADKYGTFSNGYQPKGISGHGSLSKTGKTINIEIGESDTYNSITGKKDKIFKKQNIWKAEDGTTWVWDGKNKTYKPHEQSKETGLMNNKEEQNILPATEESEQLKKQIESGAKYHKEQEENKLFKSPALEDGYQFGDVTKTILGTAGDVAVDIGKGAVQLGQGIGKVGAYGVAQMADWTGNDEYAEKVRNKIRENPDPMMSKVEDFQNKTVDKYSILGDKADQVLQSVGYTGTLMGVQGAGGTALNNLTMFLSSTGDSISNTLQENPEAENWQVWLRSSARGGTSVLTESLGGIFGKNKLVGNLEDKAYQKITEKMLSGAGKVLTKLGIDATSEAAEEFIEYAGDQLIDLGMDGISKLIGSDVKFHKEWDWNEVGESMAMAFASTMLLNGGINAVNIASTKAEARQNGQDISTKDAINILAQQINEETSQNLENRQQVNINNTSESNLNDFNEDGQQVTQTENQKLQENIENNSEQLKIDSENFSKQVDDVLNNTLSNKTDMLTVLQETPQPLIDVGLENYPITLTQKHLKTILNETGNLKNVNYHGLGIDIVKQLPEAISHPLDIVESSTDDGSIVLTTYLGDKQGRNIIASIKIDGTGRVNNINIDSNVMTSAYGRNNYEAWMDKNLESGRLLYDIDRGVIKKITRGGLQLPTSSDSVDTVDNVSTSNNIIPQNNQNMQENIENDSNIDYNVPESEVSENGEQIRTENDRLQKEENGRMVEPVSPYFERVKELTRNVKRGLAEDRARLNSVVTESLQELPISKTKVQKFVRELANNKTLTQEEIQTFLEDNNKYTEKIINDNIKNARKDISGYSFKLNDNIKNELRYKYGTIPRNIKLSNNGINVDTIYQELSNKYPDIFSAEIINESNQAEEIIEFMRNVDPISIDETTIYSKEQIEELSKQLYEYKQFFDEAKDYYGQKFLDEKRKLKNEFAEDTKENKPKKLTRKAVRENIINEWGITAEDLANGKDLKAPNYQFTDPVRVNEKVFGRKLGQKINDLTINQTKHNTAEKIRWLNKERSEIEELGIKARTKESAAVQKYGEKQFTDKNGDVHKYGDAELAAEFSDVKIQEKIKKAANFLRNKYNGYLEQINEVLTSLGYDAIPKRTDYMRHFQELGDIFSQTGVPFNLNDMKAEDLPTDINGLTEFNRPGKNWFASAQKRWGVQTTYDAITGIDGYLEGAGNLIFHTRDIQNYRALSGLIRDSFGQSKGFENLDGLDYSEIKERIDDIKNHHLSKYVRWLDQQANNLAGKKAAIDRVPEEWIGRRGYTFLNTLKSQVGSNMTGYNIRSALTNFISTTIAAAKTNKIAAVRGTVSTIRNMFKNDGFIDKSDFLTARFGSDSLSQKFWQKASSAGQIFMTGSDYLTSNLIVRSKYFEGLQKGMTESEAIKYADDFGARVMGDRSQGATAEAFNSKTLGLLTQFQLETNNQWQYMIHDTLMDYQKNSEINGGMKAGATALFQLGQLAAYSYFFNELFEAITGSRSAFDPIEILKKLFGDDDDDDEEKSFDERLSEAGELLVDNIPFGNLITGGGRIPISEAFTGINTGIKKLTNQKDKYGNDITWEDVGEDIKEAAGYWILPTGYSQLKKTTQGLSMYDENLPIAGSYTDSGNLRFTVEDDAKSKVQAGLFGRWASQSAQEYIDSGYKSISKNKIDELKELGMTSSEYREYRAGLAGQKKQEDKLEYINSLDVTDEQKSIMASNELKRDIDMSTYDDYGSFEEFDFSYKNPEKYDWLKDNNISYKKYKNNKEAYDNAYKNPEKYEMSKIITKDYIQYNKYVQNINDIKADKDSNGKTINGSRKDKVEEYVNGLDLNIAQKAILIKSTNTFKYNDYNDEIIDYINGLNMSYDKKKKTLENLDMTVDNDGNISW